LPSRIETAGRELSPELKEEIGSQQLTDTAIQFGAYVGLLLFAIALLLIVLLLRHYERQLRGTRAFFPATKLALGPCWVAAATGRVADSALSAGAASLGTAAALALSTAVTGVLFRGRTPPEERVRTLLAITVSTALTILS
jgi:hypothetical protein